MQNHSLILKWLWIGKINRDALWTTTLESININIDMLWNGTTPTNCPLFLSDLKRLLPIFNVSTQRSQQEPMILQWRWTGKKKTFVVRSAYKVLSNPGIRQPKFSKIWSIRAPPKIKVFLWLLLHNRMQMPKNLLKKGWPVTDVCVLCNAVITETANHLFSKCPTALVICSSILHLPPLNSVNEACEAVCAANRREAWAAIVWTVWWEHNRRIFQGDVCTDS